MTRPAVIITGAGKRVGAAMAQYFAAHGYDIALHYNRSEADAKTLQKEIGANCQLFSHDLTDIKNIPGLMAKIHKAMPHCVALINNASVFERASFLETDEALFDRQLTVNFKAPFFLTQAFAKTFAQGSVINVLDTDIITHQTSHFAYLLSKKALAEFTRMAARALGPAIRVNAVCPGSMLPSNQNDAAYEEKMKDIVPLKEHPSLDELSEAARWLIEQHHITGQLIFVDGGKHVL